MAIAAPRRKTRRPAPNGKVEHRIIVNGDLRLPTGFPDLDSFRNWCKSLEYPERGDVFWIDGDLWVSDEMEDFSTHNAIKTEIVAALHYLVKANKLGHVFSDRMRLVNETASLSVEPDGMYVAFESIQSGQVRLQPNERNRILEVEGSPDMVLEVASDSSEAKDARLEEKYFAAGVREYWRVDARSGQVQFHILRRGPSGFVATPRRQGRIKSGVFERSFRLVADADPIGIPRFTLEMA